jgi:hypothetical protein
MKTFQDAETPHLDLIIDLDDVYVPSYTPCFCLYSCLPINFIGLGLSTITYKLITAVHVDPDKKLTDTLRT